MKIQRKLALTIMRFLLENPKFYFPFEIGCKGIINKNEYDSIPINEEYYAIIKNNNYDNFILIENLQNIYQDTIKLMSMGFIDKILNEQYNEKAK